MSSVDLFGNSKTDKIKDKRSNNKVKSSNFLEDFFTLPKSEDTSTFLGISLSTKRINVLFVVAIFILFIFLFRSMWLQIVQGDHYKNLAENNRIRIITTPALRGVIYDRNLNKLVENVPSFKLTVIPVDLPTSNEQRNEVIGWLDNYAKENFDEINELISKESPFSYEPVVIVDNLEYKQALKAEAESVKYPGAQLKISSKRSYLLTEKDYSLSHLLGYLGKVSLKQQEEFEDLGWEYYDLVGKDGIEKQYEGILRGKAGKKKIEVDAFGNQKEIITQEKPISGSSLKLTIDTELQQVAKNSLLNILKAYGQRKGSVVVLDPNNGEILALISLPTYNNNDFASGISLEGLQSILDDTDQPLFNRAISGQYPSGSTVKPLVAVAALEEGIITNNTRIYSQGGISVDRWFYPDWKEDGHGYTDVKKAIAESVNTFFYVIGGGYEDSPGLGLERLINYFKLFGLNSKLGIDLPNEQEGFLPSEEWKIQAKDEPWYIGDTYHLAIGQGDILVTPLQVAAWTSVFANLGTLYQPHMVSQILDYEGEVVKKIKPVITRKDFVNVDNLITVKQGLRQAVTSGSAKSLLEVPVASAGKTGTAQWSIQKQPHAWFTGFIPYAKPEIVVTVLVEEGVEGSRSALVVAKEIFNWWVQNR